MKSATWTLIAVALCSGLVACGGESSPTSPPPAGPPPAPPPVGLTLSPDSLVLAPGDTSAVVANWVRPAGVTSDVLITFRNVVGGATAAVGAAGAGSTPITIVVDPSATDASRYLNVTASGAGMSGVTDSILIRITVPTP